MVSVDTSLPEWPLSLAPRTVELIADAPVISGPRPMLGAPQEVMSDAGLWRISLIDLPVYESRILQLRALLLRMLTTSTACRLPLWETQRAVVPHLPVTFSDDSIFSDGSQFADVNPTGLVAANASARATRVRISIPTPYSVDAGRIITIGNRAYCIWMITLAGDDLDCDVWPPLRDDLVIGDIVELYSPFVKARVDRRSAEQTLGKLEYGILGHVTLDFIEAGW